MNKLLIILSLLMFYFSVQASVDTLKTDAKVTGVTVFFNGAQVSRTANPVLTKGKQMLVFENLPVDLKVESIRAGGCEDCVIQSIKHKYNYVIDDLPEEEKLRDEIKAYRYKIKSVNNEMNALVIQENLLHGNNDFVSKKNGADIEQIKQAADFYGKKIYELRTQKLELARKLDQLRDERIALYKKLNAERAKTERITSSIELLVAVPASGKRSLKVEYYTKSAGWLPAYDFRVDEVGEPLKIVHNARVFQTSGEDWNRVKLNLSTGNPALSSSKPEFEPWFVERSNRSVLEEEPDKPGSISGVVRDAETQEPLPFVNVVVEKDGKRIAGGSTNMDGRYQIKPVESGYVRVKASFIGYNGSDKSAQINPEETAYLDFLMRPSAVELYEVETEDYEAPLIEKNRIVTKEDLVKMPTRSAVGVAETVGGVYSKDENRSGSKFHRVNYNISNNLHENVSNLEFEIEEPYTILSSGEDYLIQIKEVQTPADYVYFAVPKLEPAAFLTARLDDPQELNLLPAKASIYFDDTYIGETEINNLQLQDTLEISLGRDKNIALKRTGNKELQEKRFLSNTNIQTVGWEIELRNNKKVPVTIVVQDQYPLAERSSVEVELLEASNAEINPKKGELQWRLTLQPAQKKKLNFGYTVKYPSGMFE